MTFYIMFNVADVQCELIFKAKLKANSSYLGYGTKLVWNSVKSTLRAPSNLREAVMEDTIWPIRWLRLV